MNVPGWLIRVMIGYLTNRKLRVRYKGKLSQEKNLQAGAGQGCLLGLWCFLLLLNFAGPEGENETIGVKFTQPLHRRKPIPVMKKKWGDDMSILTSLNLIKSLHIDEEKSLLKPVSYHNRTGHALRLSNNALQGHVDELVRFTEQHFMKINQKKTKVALFNPHRNFDFMPEIKLSQDSENIEVVEQYKLLGQIIRTDMKTISNTENICTKAYKRMWIVRKLKELGCETSELLDVLRQQVLSVTEQAIPFWGPMITKRDQHA